MFLSGNRWLLILFEYQTFSGVNEMGSGTAGVWCGWLMAIIYMGGRLPQIYLNVIYVFFRGHYLSQIVSPYVTI